MTPYRYALVAASVILTLAGCAASSRQRPIGVGDVGAGEGSTAFERRKLEGRWTLTSLSVTTADGRKSAVDATGVMSFDGFGNLDIQYRLSEAGQKTLEGLGIKTPGLVLSTSGSSAIDPVKKQIVYAGADVQKRALAFDADLAAQRANPFTLERKRDYSFSPEGDLILATSHDDGANAATARWKKGS